ncbi:hypothetical protein VTN02DRAFT_4466 [Thermoascus thermophilus]
MMLNETVPPHQRLPRNKRRRRDWRLPRRTTNPLSEPATPATSIVSSVPEKRPLRHAGSTQEGASTPSVTERICVAKSELVALQRECTLLRECFKEAVPSEQQRNELLQKWSSNPSLPDLSPRKSQNNKIVLMRTTTKTRILRYSDTYARFSGSAPPLLLLASSTVSWPRKEEHNPGRPLSYGQNRSLEIRWMTSR